MVADAGRLRRFVAGPLNGIGLALYFALLPYVVIVKWGPALHQSDGVVVRGLLVALACVWSVFVVQLIGNVRRLRHGRRVGAGGSAWLASVIVAALPYLTSAAHPPSAREPAPVVARVTAVGQAVPGTPLRSPAGVGSLGAIPLALAARRRHDELRRGDGDLGAIAVDETIALLRARDETLVERVRAATAGRRDGVVRLGPRSLADRPLDGDGTGLVVCALGEDHDEAVIAFAREGGTLRVPIEWGAQDVEEAAVGLHDGGRLSFTRTEAELLRALATRSLRRTLVVHLGAPGALDDELRASCVIVAPVVADDRAAAAVGARGRPVSGWTLPEADEVRVELLRAEPRVVGLVEPFTATLRRRCVEMTAYLALHRHEPVTGERLRTRVLSHADVDASSRTLANTASAVRRSLGVDARGPRLHPVTSSGLYVTHGVSCDVELLRALVDRARGLSLTEAAPLAERALSLIAGEPLASALRGFEWFLAEGHAARLQRDAEWAALALHQFALEAEEYEVAFWALSQGRLVDPYSDALDDALRRVPRLRQFGGDAAGRAKDLAVGARGAVAMGGPFAGLGE
ncbi:MAG: hypothetical protein KGJ36_06330 [Acidobacteriota bacterium]|nr:hypothetical protein [Acidobacteriota bacterium]